MPLKRHYLWKIVLFQGLNYSRKPLLNLLPTISGERNQFIPPHTAHTVSLMTYEHDNHQSQQILMSGTHAESGSLSSDSGNKSHSEGMPIDQQQKH